MYSNNPEQEKQRKIPVTECNYSELRAVSRALPSFDYQGWAEADGVRFYYDQKTAYAGAGELFSMSAYQRGSTAHLPYRQERLAGYCISKFDDKSAALLLPDTSREIALKVFDVFLKEAGNMAFEQAAENAKKFWEEQIKK